MQKHKKEKKKRKEKTKSGDINTPMQEKEGNRKRKIQNFKEGKSY